jgi:hypothetical protein
MTSTTHPVESTPATLYVALELSAKEWWLTMSPTPRARPQRVRVRVGDRDGLVSALMAARTHRPGPGSTSHELLRSGTRRLLTASAADRAGRHESGRRFLQHRGLSAGAAREDRSD